MTPNKPAPDQAPTFAPPRSGRWLELLMQYRYAVVIALVFLFVFGQKALAQEFKSAKAAATTATAKANRVPKKSGQTTRSALPAHWLAASRCQAPELA